MLNLVKPKYDGESIANIYGSITRSFNADTERLGLKKGLDPNEKVVLIILDAFGMSVYRAIRNDDGVAEFFDGSDASEITSVFPSTTACAMLAFYAGLAPGESGVLGFTTYIKELGSIINMLNLSHPAQQQPIPSLYNSFERFISKKGRPIGTVLSEKGVKGYAIVPGSIFDTPTNNYHTMGLEKIKYYYPWDAVMNLREVLDTPGRAFATLYIPTVDTLSHHYGPLSNKTLFGARELIKALSAALKGVKKATIIITADHGQVFSGINHVVDEELMSALELPPFGDARAVFMKTKDVDMVKAYFNEKLKGFKMFEKKDIINEKLLGAVVEPEFEDRIGDLLAVPLIEESLVYSYNPEQDKDYLAFKGHHGGLTDQEMLVPLIVKEL